MIMCSFAKKNNYHHKQMMGSWTKRCTLCCMTMASCTVCILLLFRTKDPERPCPTSAKECEKQFSASSVECRPAKGPISKYRFTHSCLYKNLYFIRGAPTLYFTTVQQDESFFETMKNRDDFAERFRPTTAVFSSASEVCRSHCIRFHNDLSVLGDFWFGNIGHALFDSFYSVFVGVLEHRHTSPFRMINTQDPNGGTAFIESIIQRAAPLGMVYARDFFSSDAGFDTYALQEALVPNFARCISCITDHFYYGIDMGYELDAFRRLREHMLVRFQLPPSTRGTSSVLRAITISNKRFTHDDRLALTRALADAQGITGKWVDWATMDFRTQLLTLSETHIHISGPGTALVNQPFLPDGSVHINLGACSVFPFQVVNGDFPNVLPLIPFFILDQRREPNLQAIRPHILRSHPWLHGAIDSRFHALSQSAVLSH